MIARIQKGDTPPPPRLRTGLTARLRNLQPGDRLGPVAVTTTTNIYREARRLKIAVRTKILKRYPDGKLKVNVWRIK